ncbi:MAG TPA: NUDIX hydrolase, partial [Phycisphaeraceae bacterium]|nr:NUDIX hydrolase [Phycisphaeraceae bacterium]
MNDNPGAVKNWQQGQPHLLAETRIFDLKERHAVSPLSGREGDFVYLDSVDWINVIALTEQNQVVLIEQFRHGLGEVTLEIPGGMVDPGETPEQACLRELQEETGYTGETIEMIGR